MSAAVSENKENIQLNERALKERISFVLSIAADQNINTLILGAFGCGVFGQDPLFVANEFKEQILNSYPFFSNVIFAVPKDGGNPANYIAFDQVYNK